MTESVPIKKLEEMQPPRKWLCLIFLVFSLVIGASTWMTGIDFDSAFNFQVAQSLQKNFSYETRYVPSKVYHDKVTTNGPIQYFMAAMIGLFDLDLGRSIALGIIAGMAAVTIFLYSRQSFALYCLLLLFWPSFFVLHTFFLGEVFTNTMIIAGLIAWERWSDEFMRHLPSQDRISCLWNTPSLWLSSVAFGVAISTKLLAAPVTLLLLFCLAVYKLGGRGRTWPERRTRNDFLWVTWFLLPCSIALVIFGLQFSTSILHSGGHLDTIWPTLKLFVMSHFHQAESAAANTATRWWPTLESIPALIVLLGLLVLLLRKHVIFLLAGIVVAALLFVGRLDLRRLMPLIVPIMLLAAKESHSYSPGTTKLRLIDIHHSPLLAASIILFFGTFLANQPIYLLKRLSQFTLSGVEHNLLYISKKTAEPRKEYDISLISTIKALPGRVFTSGWNQYPEISLRAHTVFYDRFAPENSPLLHNNEPCFLLLFSSEDPTDLSTEHDICGQILYRDNSLILCQYSPH